jgi:predicted acyltransferase
VNARGDRGERLHSLDALRGFDMFWIVGGNAIVVAWADSNDWAWLDWAQRQTEHVEWNGFTFWDLIFPLFLFVAGAALPFSFAARRARGDGDAKLARHAVRRGLTLVALGLVYNGLLRFDLEHLRCASVLGRIGLAWMFAALIALRTTWRGRIAWIAALLLGYWAALSWIPVPGHGAGVLEPGATLTDWIDRQLLPGVLYRGDRDPEGLLSTVPAIATALLGVLAGEWLRRGDASELRKVVVLFIAGSVALALGALWDLAFPINKNLWTSSFVLWTAGWSALLLAASYLVVDVWRARRASFVFEVIGLNAITIYVLQAFVDFDALAKLLFAKGALKLHPALLAAGGLGLKWLLLFALYRARIFLRV